VKSEKILLVMQFCKSEQARAAAIRRFPSIHHISALFKVVSSSAFCIFNGEKDE
jgi:hypothetical protein